MASPRSIFDAWIFSSSGSLVPLCYSLSAALYRGIDSLYRATVTTPQRQPPPFPRITWTTKDDYLDQGDWSRRKGEESNEGIFGARRQIILVSIVKSTARNWQNVSYL
ncbi:uncharacterized protein LOC122537373 [Frieseomelitta varia]|uniref:uncharacterized protein LOC122537373 n=1 Tax=Frieseomelitta varia TaxID=561572 RepID=UPI001CB6A967|nr:uncharacterized protein LOC122537373 [Frieseomelitta varia]